jgi:ribosomal protein L40E
VIPSNFEIKDWHIKGTGGKRDDCEMNTEDGDDGTHISWMIPLVGKGERLEVSFEIKGSGEIDAEALNRFHGVHFGDEVETEDVPSLGEESVEESVAEEVAEGEESSEEEAPKVTWREDVLLRVMKASGIEDRDAFIAHAVNFDHDDNGYLKKAELEDAAKAWNEKNSDGDSTEEVEAEEAAPEEAETSEEVVEEASEQDTSDKVCPICTTKNPHDSATCSACEYVFE